MTTRNICKFFIVGAAAIIFSGPALALDVDLFIERIKELSSANGLELTTQQVIVENNDVRLMGSVFKAKSNPATRYVIPETLYKNVTEEDDGYLISNVLFDQPNLVVAFNDNDVNVTMRSVEAEDVHIPAKNTPNRYKGLLYNNLEAHDFKVSGQDKFDISATKLSSEISLSNDKSTLSYAFNADDFTVNLAKPDDTERAGIAALLGDKASGSYNLAYTWNMVDGTANLSSLDLVLKDIGALSLSFEINGFTSDFLEEFADMTSENSPEELSPSEIQENYLNLYKHLNFVEAQFKYVDDGIADRIISYAAQQKDMPAEQMKRLIKGVIPLGVAQLKLPKHQVPLSKALVKFIENPKTIMMSAKPETPVNFMQISTLAETAPAVLFQVLNIQYIVSD